MTDTTQPHPEPSEEASSLPAYLGYDEKGYTQAQWADAQSQLNAMRAERDAAIERAQFMLTMTRDAQDIASKANDRWAAICAELAALKATKEASPQGLEAAPKVDVEAIKRDARAEALRNFRHEHGQDLSDAKKWREWQEAQRLIEEEMPEGYAVTLVCSPGDWDLRFTDPECEDIRIDCYESTEAFIRTAVAHAKEHVRAAATMAQTKEG